MCNYFKISTPLFLFILKLCVEISGNSTSSDLSLICGVGDRAVQLTSIPDTLCTAVAKYTTDMREVLAIYKLKKSLPFMIILDSVDYNHKEYVKSMLTSTRTEVKYDFFVLDLNKILKVNPIMITPNATQFVIDYINAIKPVGGGAALGLFIHNDLQLFRDKNIDFNPINQVSEFYIIDPICVTGCVTSKDPENGPTIIDETTHVIAEISRMGLALNQLIYKMDLQKEGFQVDSPIACRQNENNGTTRNCQAHPTKCMFYHAKVRVMEPTLGILADRIEYDDVDGTCNCKISNDPDFSFPKLKIIKDASQSSNDYVGCTK